MNSNNSYLDLESDLKSIFEDSPETTNDETGGQITLEDIRNLLSEFLPKETTVQKDELSLQVDNILPTEINPENSILTSEFDEVSEEVQETLGGYKETDNLFIDNGGDEFVDEEIDEEKELLLDDEIPNEDEDEIVINNEEYAQPSVDSNPINLQKTIEKEIKVCGMPVQIILHGVMITPSELNYIGESCKKQNLLLKKISGEKNKLKILVEYANKTYGINYIDVPKEKTQTPFSIKEHKFESLEEAIRKIKLPLDNFNKEKKNFSKLISGIKSEKLNFSDIKESTILSDFSGKVTKNYISSWNVKSVGFVNLKSGLNEVYSNITQHSKEANTLILNESGQYFLIKGNIKDRVKPGDKKELVDMIEKKDYGIIQVVGIFENSQKGLGQIMFKTKRTSVPLLIWR